MNGYLEMVLKWARDNQTSALIAHGWLLRENTAHIFEQGQQLDPVDYQYAANVIAARIRGVSA